MSTGEQAPGRHSGEQRRFVWPPAPASGEEAQASVASHADPDFSIDLPPDRRRLGLVMQLIRGFERELLGVTAPPLAERLAAAGERFESPAEACWRCAGSIGPGEADGDGCAACRSKKLAWDRALRLGPYEGVLAEAVRQVKFTGWRRLGDDLGRALGRRLLLARNRWAPRAVPVIVPVPMSRRARLARGVDHTLTLARGISGETGWPIARALAQRHGPPQHRLPASKRAANVRGRFLARRAGVDRVVALLDAAGPDRPRLVILLDDVRTTGATLTAAGKALRKALEQDSAANRPAPGIWAVTAAAATDRRRAAEAAGGASQGPGRAGAQDRTEPSGPKTEDTKNAEPEA